ncbi:unnamed protein product [Malus baccata var. baccata]
MFSLQILKSCRSLQRQRTAPVHILIAFFSCFRLVTYLIENAVELEKIVLHHDVHFWDVPAQKSIEENKREDEERNRATQQLKATVPSRIQFDPTDYALPKHLALAKSVEVLNDTL